jgi:CubicO group peptidase (beta-lactamase class C family)
MTMNSPVKRISMLMAPACAALLLASPAGSTPRAEVVAAKADAYLRARTAEGKFSGSVLLARDGEVLFVKGYGFANEEWGVANAADTRFPIASITKTFTAALVLELQRQKKLSLADPLCKHVSPCPKAWHAITIRQLLTHTAGIPDYAKDPDFMQKVRLRRDLAGIIAGFRDRPLTSPPGTRYEYSNSGYLLLGHVLERAGRKSYGELLREHIFEPLGMRHTTLDDNARLIPKRASGYRASGRTRSNADYVDTSWLHAAGGIHSTVGDLLIWERALFAGTFLPPDEVNGMWAPAHGSYGYGWQLLSPSAQTFNRRLVFHAGGTTGFATDLLIYPQQKVTVIILANLMPVALAELSRDLSGFVFGETPPS